MTKPKATKKTEKEVEKIEPNAPAVVVTKKAGDNENSRPIGRGLD